VLSCGCKEAATTIFRWKQVIVNGRTSLLELPLDSESFTLLF
jgi:hypothetical protein